MAGLFDKQAEDYLEGRPTYPPHLYSMLAALTTHHALAWDVGTGNGQAALGVERRGCDEVIEFVNTMLCWQVAEHYEQVIATDVSEAQLKCAIPHPRVKYLHTPLSLPDDEIVRLIGGEGSVDLVTVAQAVHWFDLPTFYPLVTRLLRKPGGVFAVWGYNGVTVSPTVDALSKRFYQTTLPFWSEKTQHAFDGYKTLPFPFESVGLGCEGQPVSLDIPHKLSFDGFLRMSRSWSAVATAKDQGIDLLSEEVVKEFETAWGGPQVIASVTCRGFILAGKVKL